ncbi:hypothetical protein [Streptomonospora wellingtoniae]|uniref:Twin-arginine translocation signal domain-containing protein n=1 Tax=Streptomonospora wellingtoniae TaxID=3075544 RepID=A0ABU2KV85_9ACTN|nr:hypothetical protein [Streptomonospora sp. DSM 45055]MDT0303043.1 hypothetical protein [Streptomonospora sp. DSM 45055]
MADHTRPRSEVLSRRRLLGAALAAGVHVRLQPLGDLHGGIHGPGH